MAGMQKFIDDDPGYLEWLSANPTSFVLNTYRPPTPAYLILHRAICHTISELPVGGTTWTREYMKIYGERAELEWV